MTDEDEGGWEDGAHLVLLDQLVALELPDLHRVGVVTNERCTTRRNQKQSVLVMCVCVCLNDSRSDVKPHNHMCVYKMCVNTHVSYIQGKRDRLSLKTNYFVWNTDCKYLHYLQKLHIYSLNCVK